MSLKTLSAKFHPQTIEAVEKRCKQFGCSKSEFLRFSINRTLKYINSLVYRTKHSESNLPNIKTLEDELSEALAELETLTNEDEGEGDAD